MAKLRYGVADFFSKFSMHYLASLSNKIVSAYQNQENILNSAKSNSAKTDTRILAEAVQSVLEQEIENGRLRYDLLRTQYDEAQASDHLAPFFAEILSPRG